MSVHVTCGSVSPSAGALRGMLDWSQTMTAAGTTMGSVPGASFERRLLVITAFGSDAWVAIGPSPNAAADPRHRIPQGTSIPFLAQPGDTVAWAPA